MVSFFSKELLNLLLVMWLPSAPYLSVVSVLSGPQLWTHFQGFPTVLGYTQMLIKCDWITSVNYRRGMAFALHRELLGSTLSLPEASSSLPLQVFLAEEQESFT